VQREMQHSRQNVCRGTLISSPKLVMPYRAELIKVVVEDDTAAWEVGWTKGLELAKVARRDGQQFDCATWLHRARSLPKEEFERELTGRESEPWEIVYFKLYKTQIPIVEQAIETAALMLGTDKSRGYCLEMICADILAGANLEGEDPTMLLQSMSRFFEFLAGEQRQAFLQEVREKAS